MPGKYTPLESYLKNLPAGQRQARLSFAEIEAILKTALPASAYEDERWWRHATEANHASPRAWTSAGWSIARLDVAEKWVEFSRAS